MVKFRVSSKIRRVEPPSFRLVLGVALGALAMLPIACGETIVSIVDRQGTLAGAAGGGSGGVAGSGGGLSGGGNGGVAASAAGVGAGSNAGEAGGGPDDCSDELGATQTCPCGVGIPPTDLCLLHHYTFDGANAIAVDVMGDADGIVVNATLSDGTVVLDGGNSDQYVQIPPGLISARENVTVEVWTTWNTAGTPWQRLFDFGNSDGGTLAQGFGQTYLFVSPRDGSGVLKAAFSLQGPGGETLVQGSAPLSSGTLEHLAVVVDDTANRLSLYSNGALVGFDTPLRGSLSALRDENCWLGRSQFELDAEYGGVIHDLRIFGTARTAEQIAASFAAGPDTLPSE
jgi:hypothetical protein